MKKRALVTLLGILLMTPLSFGHDEPKSIPFDGTGPFKHVDGSGPHRDSSVLLEHHRNRARAANASAAVSEDVGDVAVVVDNGAIIRQPFPANPIDLSFRNITFTPTAGGFNVGPSAATGLDPAVGGALPQGDDTTVEVALGFSFPFVGNSYSSMFVNSDGNITFGAGDTSTDNRDAARLIGGPPRAAPLLMDLDVTSGGSINAGVRSDRAVVTWTNVPEFGTSNLNTLQVTLRASGQIDFAYGSLGTAIPSEQPFPTFAAAGVAEGNNEEPFNEIDFTSALPTTLQAGAIFEEFHAEQRKQVDIVQLAKEFYKTHGDKYDFMVMFTDFESDLFDAFAFEFTVRNQTRGIGTPLVDNTQAFGSQGELESFVNMNNINFYWPDERKLVDPPIDMFRFSGGANSFFPPGSDQLSRRARRMGTRPGDGVYTLGLNSAMSVMAQETGHRWGAFVPFVHPTKGIGFDSFDLLGRDFAHWSFFFNVRVADGQFGGDPRASSMEGNAIIDFGGNVFGDCRPGQTRFRTEPNELVDGYTELDQYLMGLRRDSAVGPFWYVDEPRQPSTGVSFEFIRGIIALDDIGFCGKRVDLTVANIQAFPGVGPRVPAIGDEDDDGNGNDVKTMAFILLIEQGTPRSHAAAIQQVDNFRRTWQQYANGPATGARGKFDTSLNPVIY